MFSAATVLVVPALTLQLMSPATAPRPLANGPASAVADAATDHNFSRLAAVTTPRVAHAGGSPVTQPMGVWPLTPRPEVVRGFSPPLHAWDAGHRGVDLLGRPGQVVRAALAGVVTFAAPIAGRGVVVVTSGPLRTTYEPVTASVRRGDHVSAGSVIGRLQVAGSHCLPRSCLHWGLIEGTTYRDPLSLVGARGVRLLPLDVPSRPVPLPLPVPDQARGWAWW